MKGYIKKTQTIMPDELKSLRKAVCDKYEERVPGAILEAKTYLGAYEALQEDIVSSLSQSLISSVSPSRLRKLFYYTNPDVCPLAQLEKPTFGRDFIDALYTYIRVDSLEEHTKEERRFFSHLYDNSKKLLWIMLFSVILINSTLIFTIFLRSDGNWREDFDFNNVDELKSTGWEFWDIDSSYLYRQPKLGYLTLYTLPGDLWVKPNEKQQVSNIIAKKINSDIQEITLCLKGFVPYQRDQQAGLFLFNRNKTRHLRITIAYTHHVDENPPNTIGWMDLTTVNYRSNSEIVFKLFSLWPISHDNLINNTPRLVTLKIFFKDKKCLLYIKESYDWSGYKYYGEIALDFNPRYLGLAAFQGWTFDDYSPKCADNLPVSFDWITVKYNSLTD